MKEYLKEIARLPLLSPSQERIADADALVRHNLRLVVSIARAYQGRGLSLEDLIQDGNLGLMRAARLFDPGRAVRFSTYATYHIRQAIRRGLQNTGRMIRVPVYRQYLGVDGPAVHCEGIGRDGESELSQVADDDACRPLDVMVEYEDLEAVRERVGRLDERTATVLRLRFGLDDGEPRTLAAVGECVGLTRERVRQLEIEGIEQLRCQVV